MKGITGGGGKPSRYGLGLLRGVKVAKNHHRKSKRRKTVSQVPRSSVTEGRVARTSGEISNGAAGTSKAPLGPGERRGWKKSSCEGRRDVVLGEGRGNQAAVEVRREEKTREEVRFQPNVLITKGG